MVKCNLPGVININDVSEDSIKKAYSQYLKDVGNNKNLVLNGYPVKVTTELDYNLRQQTFEHIISRDMKARLYDLNRMNKIPWIKYIIECANSGKCEECSCYSERKNSFCIWCKKENYLIVFELRTDKKTNNHFYYLKTAYPVTYTDKLNKMIKKDLQRHENGKN